MTAWLALLAGLLGAGPHLEAASVLEDPGGTLTFEDVQGRAAGDFRPLAPGGENQGYGTSTWWLRVRVRSDGASPLIVIPGGTNPWEADLYTDLGGEPPHHSGLGHPFAAREVAHPLVAFRLALPPGEEHQLWMRVTSRDTVTLAPRVWTEASFWKAATDRYLLDGLYYGLVLGLIAYNLVLYAVTRDRSYGWYVAFEVAMVLTLGAFDKYAFAFLWPWRPVWAARSELVIGALAVASGIAFAREFVGTREAMPRLDRALRALALVDVAISAASTRTDDGTWKTLACAAFVLSMALVWTAAARLARQRNEVNARVLVIAWAALIGGAVLGILSSLGTVSTIDGYQYMKLGSATEAVLLSVALASRLNALTRAREQTQRELLAAKSERLEALGRLVSGVAHEVGNPLNYALGGAEVLADRLGALERESAAPLSGLLQSARRSQQLVSAGLERIKTIVDNLRVYVRSREEATVRTDLCREVEQALDLARERIERGGVRVERALSTLPPVAGRPGEMHQVLLNLITNAVQAMPSGGLLRVSARAVAGQIELSVEDEGPGVDPANAERIFEPFFTTRSAEGGTGLGLAVSREIVLRHGGQLRVEGRGALPGARFVMSLPGAE
ncbi:MAG TPA: 7TM diverse intracellular signaling domain-containing protein [Myxococcaceae bacterium]|nr:7TM diverse intracellular signaling domain-containing protein [Myxococcaceae bacterium]